MQAEQVAAAAERGGVAVREGGCEGGGEGQVMERQAVRYERMGQDRGRDSDR